MFLLQKYAIKIAIKIYELEIAVAIKNVEVHVLCMRNPNSQRSNP